MEAQWPITCRTLPLELHVVLSEGGFIGQKHQLKRNLVELCWFDILLVTQPPSAPAYVAAVLRCFFFRCQLQTFCSAILILGTLASGSHF
jgi:hypothetical protein